MIIAICTNEAGIVTRSDGTYKCLQGYRSFEQVDLVATGQHYTPDPTLYGVTFGASFMLVGSFYAVGMGIRAVLKMLR